MNTVWDWWHSQPATNPLPSGWPSMTDRIEKVGSHYDLLSCEDFVSWFHRQHQELYDWKIYYSYHLTWTSRTTRRKKCSSVLSLETAEVFSARVRHWDAKHDKLRSLSRRDDKNHLQRWREVMWRIIKKATIKMQLQANDISRQMKAKFVIWPHFFKHYAKIFLIAVENEGIAFDHMEVTQSDFNDAFMSGPLKAMFSDHVELMKQKALESNQHLEQRIGIKLPNSTRTIKWRIRKLRRGLKWKSLFFSQLSV